MLDGQRCGDASPTLNDEPGKLAFSRKAAIERKAGAVVEVLRNPSQLKHCGRSRYYSNPNTNTNTDTNTNTPTAACLLLLARELELYW